MGFEVIRGSVFETPSGTLRVQRIVGEKVLFVQTKPGGEPRSRIETFDVFQSLLTADTATVAIEECAPRPDDIQAAIHEAEVPEVPAKSFIRAMGFNLIWYAPACLLAICLTIENVAYELRYIPILEHYWSVVRWGMLLAFFSPAADITLGFMVTFPFMPICWAIGIIEPFENTEGAWARIRLVTLWMITLPVIVIVMVFVIEHSFPFVHDSDGTLHMRMIPFIPFNAS